MLNYTFHGMNIGQLLLWFFIYSFCGWAMECVVIRLQLGRWENRGFAKMPFCVIYGFGTFIAFHLFAPIQNNYFVLYIAGAVCATIFEYLTAMVMLKLFGEVWWNYDHLPFNYKGILCLQSTLGWGFLALFIFGLFNRLVEWLVFAMNPAIAAAIGGTLAIMYVIDFGYHFSKNVMANYLENEDQEENGSANPIEHLVERIRRK